MEGEKMDEEWESPYARRGSNYISEANEIMLETRKAHENEILDALNFLSARYAALLEDYFTTAYGKKKQLTKEINNLKLEQEKNKNYGIRKTLEVKAFTEYVRWLEVDSNTMRVAEIIESRIDDLYREEDSIERMKNQGAVNDLAKNLAIPANGKFYVVKLDRLTECQLNRAIWAEKNKHYIKNMSREKALRFLSSATKRANETGVKLIENKKLIEKKIEERTKLDAMAKTEQGILERNKFIETKINPFEKELESIFVPRIRTFLTNAPDSPFKSKLRRILSEGQKEIQAKAPKQKIEFVSPKTIEFALGKICSNDLILQNYSNQNASQDL